MLKNVRTHLLFCRSFCLKNLFWRFIISLIFYNNFFMIVLVVLVNKLPIFYIVQVHMTRHDPISPVIGSTRMPDVNLLSSGFRR